MRVRVYSLEGEPTKELELPRVFEEELRPDLIKRAVLSAQTSRLHPWGANKFAGKRTTAETWGKGFGVARVPRVKGTRYPAAGRGALAPHTVGGRRAHPPKVEKILKERINKKERKLAVRSAIAATAQKEVVSSRGHKVEQVKEFPLVVSDELEGVSRTKEVKKILQNLGTWADVERVIRSFKVRAGKGKMRGRRYRRAVGPLIVVGKDRGIKLGARNLPGVDVVLARDLNAELLAPGGVPGRLTLWTHSAIEKLAEVAR